ncbi:MAG: DNA polymerase III subunit alpha [Chitinophagaceae bacterium]|nr:DNA polymerase III subunit alpha [Chitinophagaceae bacterium]
MKFSHLHVHTQYSLLDGAAPINKLFDKAIADGMPALAISDHGNMFGVFEFVKQAHQRKNPDGSLKVKPIVGCEFYITENRHKKQFTKGSRDPRHHQILLAKNETGYKNLIKLTSLGYIEGLYSKYPRIDKELINKYHEGLIATTCCIGATIPQLILNKGEEEAENEFKWWLNIFQDDFYVEIQRHGMEEQDRVNEVLLKFAKKYNVKVIATNDSHYVNEEDANAHDILLCINTGSLQSDEKMTSIDDDVTGRNKRFAFPNNEFYLKKTDEMIKVFHDIPQAIDNTNEIVDKVETLNLFKSVLLPNFPLPKGYTSQMEYLADLTWKGAYKRYKEVTPEIEARIKSELDTIEFMGFAGYFLIVSDFVNAGRNMGVFIGPGRGSAAGSAVAYCIGITNVDPIKYDLIFERFLNRGRKSMPDIDTDFDDEARQKVLDYVVDKYGKNQVAQIITYGTMAARSSIKDVARVLDLPLPESNALSKLVPEKPGTTLKKVLHAPETGPKSLAEEFSTDEIGNIKILREIYQGKDLKAEVLHEAEILEGSIRNTGVHASAVIIAPADLMTLIPVATSKESDLWLTQIEGNDIESAGVIKMDFLGLRTLSILKTALRLIKQNYGVDIDLDKLPLDDEVTYQLFQRGETTGIFQFESPGMRKHLKELRPDKFEDLIAMNALYRPGPMQYIPNYIDRKHGREDIVYDLPEMEEFLKETYGVTVYQEQVMLLSQKLGGFNLTDADELRKAMGKKKREILDKMKVQFLSGGKERGHPEKILDKIWSDWEAFAQYAFNKSHSTCYAYLAFQTGYLKAHYPSEYMAALLNHAGNIDKITFFMDECQAMNIKVLGPDINESEKGFSVNKKGEIRIGLSGIKGVGDAAIENIIAERALGGEYTSIFDLVQRVNQRAVNKKSLESLVVAGTFDSFGDMHRAAFFHTEPGDNMNTLEKIIRYGNEYQLQSKQSSATLFGEMHMDTLLPPVIPECEPWSLIEKLEKEKEVVGLFLSGHPLDNFKFEINHYDILPIKDVLDYKEQLALGKGEPQSVRFSGMVSKALHRTSKKGTKYGTFIIEDFDSSIEFSLFTEDYLRYSPILEPGTLVFIKATFRKRYDRDEYNLQVQEIILMDSLMKKHTKAVEMMVVASDLTNDMVEFFIRNFKENPGAVPFSFDVFDDSDTGHKVSLVSEGMGITMNPQLSEFLAGHKEIMVKVQSN